MLAPVAPHISEELWERLGRPYSIHLQSWPEVDEAAAAQEEITLVVQVNGKVRDRIIVPVELMNKQPNPKPWQVKPCKNTSRDRHLAR